MRMRGVVDVLSKLATGLDVEAARSAALALGNLAMDHEGRALILQSGGRVVLVLHVYVYVCMYVCVCVCSQVGGLF